MPVTTRALSLLVLTAALACGPADATTAGAGADDDPVSLCGPSRATVSSVIDGDTIVLSSGAKVRYLMIDSPEITSGKNDCYGQDARIYNESLVLGQEVELTYDVECADQYGRLLAYVDAPDGEVNSLLVERGFACVLVLPPNGEARESEFLNLELGARQKGAGMWGACEEVTCD
jgi:micrococcal nuclease